MYIVFKKVLICFCDLFNIELKNKAVINGFLDTSYVLRQKINVFFFFK